MGKITILYIVHTYPMKHNIWAGKKIEQIDPHFVKIANFSLILPSSVPVGQFQLSPIWTEICIISENYHPPRILVMTIQKSKFGMQALFDQTMSTS